MLFQIPGTKKSLTQLGTPTNIQNDDIKLSGCNFRLDVIRFLHRGKIFNPENSFALFYDQPYRLLPFSVLQLHIKWHWLLGFLREERNLLIERLRE